MVVTEFPKKIFEGLVLLNAMGEGGGVSFPGKNCYEGVRFKFISVTRGWVG